jgi:hypothetical protein
MTVSPVSGALRRITGLTPDGASLGSRSAPAAVIKLRTTLAPGRLPHLVEFLLRCITVISVAGRQQLLGDFVVPRRPRKLIDHSAVPVDPEPVETIKDGVDCGLGGSGPVGVLDA